MANQQKIFWDSVSNIYSSSDLTNHVGDHELSYVLKNYQDYAIKNLICMGVADGCRDPITILASKNNIPKLLVVNDFSPKLLETCTNKMLLKFPNISPCYDCGEMKDVHKRNSKLKQSFENGKIIHGVYNVDYIMESLNLYAENNSVIGKNMNIGFLYWQNNNLHQSPDSINFDNLEINNVPENVQSFIKKSLKLDNFVAISVHTETGFISHYYSPDGLNKMFSYIYPNNNFKIIVTKERYIIVECFFGESKNTDTMVTNLNNVIGNIPYFDQIDSITAVKNFFV